MLVLWGAAGLAGVIFLALSRVFANACFSLSLLCAVGLNGGGGVGLGCPVVGIGVSLGVTTVAVGLVAVGRGASSKSVS